MAIDCGSGERLWRVDIGDRDPTVDELDAVMGPIVDDGTVYVPTGQVRPAGPSKLVALGTDGVELWEFTPPSATRALR